MKALVVNRLKKWIFFAVIGCVAYFVGYFWGHRHQPPLKGTSPSVTSPKSNN